MLFIGSIGEIICAVIAAAAGHTMLASADTPASEYTSRNTTGGQILVAFAIIQVSPAVRPWCVPRRLHVLYNRPLRSSSSVLSGDQFHG
jgi:hypothetical protein